MKTTYNENGTLNVYGRTKTIGRKETKRKLVYDTINFTRENPDYISEFDLVIDGVLVGHCQVPYSNLFQLNGIDFPTEKAMLEYAVEKLDR